MTKILNEQIEKSILVIRGHRVMLDSDLAEIYGVTTKRLNEQVRRNVDRFPKDFMFQLIDFEYESLRSQFATSKKGRGGRRFLPYVFTEHGAIMLTTVLDSPVAINASIEVVRAFSRLRKMLSTNAELGRKLTELEEMYDQQFKVVFEAIHQLMLPPPNQGRRRIGIQSDNENS
jgi:hypothetical protein